MTRRHPYLSGDDLQRAVSDAARCRSSRHHRFDPIPAPPGTPRPTFGELMVLRCDTCGTLAYDKVSQLTGQRIAPRVYDHPSWYADALTEKHDSDWWRATWFATLDPEYFVKPETVVRPLRRKRRAS